MQAAKIPGIENSHGENSRGENPAHPLKFAQMGHGWCVVKSVHAELYIPVYAKIMCVRDPGRE